MTFDDLKLGMMVAIDSGDIKTTSKIVGGDPYYQLFEIEGYSCWFSAEDIDPIKTKEINETKEYETNPIKPNHYKMNINGIDIEARDIMQAVATEEEYNGFLYCNVIKYVLRAKRKNGIEDLKKAKLYLKWLIEEKETKE